MSKLAGELAEILVLRSAHGTQPLTAALERAVQFRRWQAADIRSILAAAGAAPNPQPVGEALVLTLPWAPTDPWAPTGSVETTDGHHTAPPVATDLTEGLNG